MSRPGWELFILRRHPPLWAPLPPEYGPGEMQRRIRVNDFAAEPLCTSIADGRDVADLDD